MKKLIVSCLCLLMTINMMAQSVVKESLSFQSSILKKEVRYSIYLPEDYNTSERRYPVLYLLHGWGDNETSWLQMGDLKNIADETINSNKAVNMIIVLPNADETWYVNTYDGKVMYEDMFFKELIPYVDKTYRTRTQSQYRAIAGLSMGGYGSFLYSLHNPSYFSACAPLSAAIYTDEILDLNKKNYRGKLFDNLYGKGNLTEHWHKNSVIDLLNQLPADSLSHIRYYIDCGDEDGLLHGNNIVHEIMNKKKVKHEFRVRDGGHTWTYWRTALPSVLEFVSKRFNRS